MDENKKANRLLRNNMESIILRTLFDGKKYGYEIVKEIEEKVGGEVGIKHTTLYNNLKRLVGQGLVTSFWGNESQGGRRKYFSLTIEGFQLCQKQQTEWEYSRHILDKLVSSKEFDGDRVVPEIDIAIGKKTRTARSPKSQKGAETDTEDGKEILDALDDIAEDLNLLPDQTDESSIKRPDTAVEPTEVKPVSEAIEAKDEAGDADPSASKTEAEPSEKLAQELEKMDLEIEEPEAEDSIYVADNSSSEPQENSDDIEDIVENLNGILAKINEDPPVQSVTHDNEESSGDTANFVDNSQSSDETADTENLFVKEKYERISFEFPDEPLYNEPPSEYYRELDRNIDALMEDDEVDDVIDSAISNTDDLLGSAVPPPPPPASTPTFVVQPPIGHVNMDYLFNLYNNKPEPSSPVKSPAPPPTPARIVYDGSSQEDKEEYKSFAEAKKTVEVDIFEDEQDSVDTAAESPAPQPEPTAAADRAEPAYIPRHTYDYHEEESENERDYKKIIGNLLHETRPPKKDEEAVSERTAPKSHSSTADKILSSVDAAQYTYNLDKYESTGDIPSGGYAAIYNSAPLGADMLFDLKEKLSNEGIKLRQYEKSPKTSSERYQFYYKNKVLFATLWIVFALAIIELGIMYLFFGRRDDVTITIARMLVYMFIMIIPALVGTVINYSKHNVKVRAEWDFGYRLRDSLIIFTVGFFVIVSVNLLQIFAPFAFNSSNDLVVLLVMPSVMLLNVILGTAVYFLLYRSNRYIVK